jgi:hypothetical protein
MAGKRRKPIEIVETGESLRGNRLIKPINHLIDKLHDVGTERDHAGNRKLFFDQYATLLLLDFLTPSLDSLRALREATGWEKSRRKLGIESTSLGSLRNRPGLISRFCRRSDGDSLVPTVLRGNAVLDALRRLLARRRRSEEDAERPGRHSHAERGNESNREVILGLILSLAERLPVFNHRDRPPSSAPEGGGGGTSGR